VKSLRRSSYYKQSERYIEKHFGDVRGVVELYPYMDADFPWGGIGERDVLDPRTARKSNHEYHGLELAGAGGFEPPHGGIKIRSVREPYQ
jgi:hypothetical protein